MTPFLTVKEAARLTGKSTSSIRRVIYPIIRDDNHADRGNINPSPEEAVQLRVKGENFAWRISEELLRREITVGDPRQGAESDSPTTNNNSELLGTLRRELEIKNNQISKQGELISKQMELINGLTERLREGNILIGSLHQRLALPDGGSTAAQSVTATRRRRPISRKPEKGSKIPESVKPKRSLLSRIFG